MATQIRITYHQGSARDVRTVTAPDMEPASMVSVIRRAAVHPPHVTETMGARMGRELEESGRYELGWVTYEVIA